MMGLFFTVPLLMKVRKGPNMVSSATAWRTLLPPIRLADLLARITPTSTNGFQKVNSTMYMQSLWSRLVSQVRAVRRDRIMKVVKVKRLAERVPLGMHLPEEMRSPEQVGSSHDTGNTREENTKHSEEVNLAS